MLLKIYFLGVFSYIVCMYAFFLKIESDEEMYELLKEKYSGHFGNKKEMIISVLYMFYPIVHWVYAITAFTMLVNDKWWDKVKEQLRDR